MSTFGRRPPRQGRALTWLFIAVVALGAATSPGSLSADPHTRFAVAEALIRTGSPELPGNLMNTVEHNGRRYCVFFPGQSLLFLPFAAVAVLVSGVGLSEAMASWAARFLAGALGVALLAAVAVTGHVAILRLLGAGLGPALRSGAMLVLATPLLVYAGTGSEEIVLAALAIVAFWALVDARTLLERATVDGGTEPVRAALLGRVGLAGFAIAMGLIHRATFVAVAVGALVLALPVLRRIGRLGSSWRSLAVWALAACAVLATVPVYNWMRFGHLLDSGYGRFYEPLGGVFSTPLALGLCGHLLSPGKSIFLYAPWLILLGPAIACRAVRQRPRGLGAALLAIVVVHLILYSKFLFWSGEWCWAVRFHVSLLPLVTLPIGLWLATEAFGPCKKALVVVVAVVSVAVQLSGSSFSWGLEHFQHREDFTGPMEQIPAGAAWTWEGSQLRRRLVNIDSKLRGRKLIEVDDSRSEAILNSWRIYPARGAIVLDSPGASSALWTLWAANLLVVAIALWRVAYLSRGSLEARAGPRRPDRAATE